MQKVRILEKEIGRRAKGAEMKKNATYVGRVIISKDDIVGIVSEKEKAKAAISSLPQETLLQKLQKEKAQKEYDKGRFAAALKICEKQGTKKK